LLLDSVESIITELILETRKFSDSSDETTFSPSTVYINFTNFQKVKTKSLLFRFTVGFYGRLTGKPVSAHFDWINLQHNTYIPVRLMSSPRVDRP